MCPFRRLTLSYLYRELVEDVPTSIDPLRVSLQSVMPNWWARAFRHIVFTMRFITKGPKSLLRCLVAALRCSVGDVTLKLIWVHSDNEKGRDCGFGVSRRSGLSSQFPAISGALWSVFTQPRSPAEDVKSRISPLVIPWSEMKATLDNVVPKRVAHPSELLNAINYSFISQQQPPISWS